MTDYKLGKTPTYDAVLSEFRTVAMGKGLIGQGELLKRMGRQKATEGIRRALKNLAREGIVEPFRYLTEKGGQAVGYKVIVQLEQMPLPFGDDGFPF